MIALDPAESIQMYPMSMARFGLTPYGENRFRVILASSRRHLVCGQINLAGAKRAMWVRTYPDIPGQPFILEEWVDAFTFTGCTRDQWAYGDGQFLGPYPYRGEYQMCGSSGFKPEEVNIEKLIRYVHAADNYSWTEKLYACRKKAEADEAATANEVRAIIQDSFPAFGHAPFMGYGGHGGSTKTSPVLRSANELGLPVPQGIPGQVTTGGSMIVPKRKRRRAA